MRNRAVIRTGDIDAVIFDLDGVITKTAAAHATAWERLFNDYLEERSGRTGQPSEPFTTQDYNRYVDGKPRYDGVQSFLESRGIELGWGDSSDPAERETVCGLGNRKNAYFLEQLRTRGVEPYESSVRLVTDLQAAGLGTALFTSSRNAGPVLEAAGLADLFEVRVDGLVAADLGLPGKPDPAVLLEATRRLGCHPSRTAVVEDALSGVEAGRRGAFALVIGVDRTGQAEDLARRGADVVVPDLEWVTIEESPEEAPMRDLPSALDSSSELTARLSSSQAAVFLDYDGTLTPIVRHPDLAILAPETRGVLEALAGVTTVAIVSGRDVADVIDKVAVGGIYYAGSHGFDIVAPSGEAVSDGSLARFESFLPSLDAAQQQLAERLADVPGANVERKRFAIAVHYREVPDGLYPRVEAAVRETAPGYPDLRVTTGKKIFELRPDVEWDKGKALEWLLEEMELSGPEIVPMYLGDDTTDEDAFRAIRGRGIGIVVGREDRSTAAHYALEDPDEVRTFLNDLRTLLEEVGA